MRAPFSATLPVTTTVSVFASLGERQVRIYQPTEPNALASGFVRENVALRSPRLALSAQVNSQLPIALNPDWPFLLMGEGKIQNPQCRWRAIFLWLVLHDDREYAFFLPAVPVAEHIVLPQMEVEFPCESVSIT